MHRQRFDAALTTPEALRAWSGADELAPNAAASQEVRRILRKRGRYEQFCNPFTDGQLQTLSGDVVGTGPRLRMQTADTDINSLIEQEVGEWMNAIRIAKRLRLAIETVAAVGEIFCHLFVNPKLSTPVHLDLRLYEGDQIATPDLMSWDDNDRVDGIEFDAWQNPTFYHVLDQHPGDTSLFATRRRYTRIPAADMIHLFKQRRPGQRRGIPRITSSLPLFLERRAFRQSTLAAARIAAELGAVLLQSNAPPEEEDFEAAEPWSTQEIERGQITSLPLGFTANQLKAEHPNTTYSEFDDRLISEGARPLQMPRNIATCDSSGYNYASGQLDHQTYDRSIGIERGDDTLDLLDVLLKRWITEALLIPGYLPSRARSILSGRIPHAWLWRGRRHADPTKAATAEEIELEDTISTITDKLSERGTDFEQHLETLDREVQAYTDRGLVHPAMRNASRQRTSNSIEDSDQKDEADDGNVPARNRPARAIYRRNGRVGGGGGGGGGASRGLMETLR